MGKMKTQLETLGRLKDRFRTEFSTEFSRWESSGMINQSFGILPFRKDVKKRELNGTPNSHCEYFIDFIVEMRKWKCSSKHKDAQRIVFELSLTSNSHGENPAEWSTSLLGFYLFEKMFRKKLERKGTPNSHCENFIDFIVEMGKWKRSSKHKDAWKIVFELSLTSNSHGENPAEWLNSLLGFCLFEKMFKKREPKGTSNSHSENLVQQSNARTPDFILSEILIYGRAGRVRFQILTVRIGEKNRRKTRKPFRSRKTMKDWK